MYNLANEPIQNTTAMMQIIEECYRLYRANVRGYILYKLEDADLAEDLTQDTFLRLMECGQLIRRETMRQMVFTIARNLVIDYLRRFYCRQEIEEYLQYTANECSCQTESEISARDLARKELQIVRQLPAQRQKVYTMVRFQDKRIQEVADELHLAPKTVENHLNLSRKLVREQMRACI